MSHPNDCFRARKRETPAPLNLKCIKYIQHSQVYTGITYTLAIVGVSDDYQLHVFEYLVHPPPAQRCFRHEGGQRFQVSPCLWQRIQGDLPRPEAFKQALGNHRNPRQFQIYLCSLGGWWRWDPGSDWQQQIWTIA